MKCTDSYTGEKANLAANITTWHIAIYHILLWRLVFCFCKTKFISFLLVFLTYTVWDDLQQVLCEQQVSESQEAI